MYMYTEETSSTIAHTPFIPFRTQLPTADTHTEPDTDNSDFF